MRGKETLPGNTAHLSPRPTCDVHAQMLSCSCLPPWRDPQPEPEPESGHHAGAGRRLLGAATGEGKGLPQPEPSPVPCLFLSPCGISCLEHLFPPSNKAGLVLSFSVRGAIWEQFLFCSSAVVRILTSKWGDVQGSGFESLQTKKETGSTS